MILPFKQNQVKVPILLDEFKLTKSYLECGERMRTAWVGDAIIRLHVRIFLRERFKGRASLNDFECLLNSNEWMGKFLGRHISDVIGAKTKADIFESFVYYLYNNNHHTEFLNDYCYFYMSNENIEKYKLIPICPLFKMQ